MNCHNGIPQLIRHVTDGAKPIVAGGVDKDIHSTPLLFDQVEGVLEVARGSHITWKRKPYSPRWRISLTVASATPVSLRKPSMDEPMSNTATRTSSSAKASAMARPIPRPAPVTMATFPEIVNESSLSGSERHFLDGSKSYYDAAVRHSR